MIGKKYNRLTIMEFSHYNKYNRPCWKCSCDCGKEVVVSQGSLVTGHTKSCGCSRYHNLTNKKFGRLLVLELDSRKNRQIFWKCLCDCGNIKIASGLTLRNGGTKSCGCLLREYENLTGKKYNRLTVIKHTKVVNNKHYWICECECGKLTEVKSCGCLLYEREDLTGKRFVRYTVLEFSHRKNGDLFWKCRCDCGNIKIVSANSLRRGAVMSCGCYSIEINTIRFTGHRNPRWRGGIDKGYPKEWTKGLREKIRNRDNRRCQYPDCDYSDIKQNKLDVHHIDGNKNNCGEENLISLCRRHHNIIERNNPDSWIDYFSRLIGDY